MAESEKCNSESESLSFQSANTASTVADSLGVSESEKSSIMASNSCQDSSGSDMMCIELNLELN